MHKRPLPSRQATRTLHASLLFIICAALYVAPYATAQDAGASAGETPGSLRAVGAGGKQRGLCPLKRTEVRANVTGFLARVNVTQEFENPFDEKIEAVYTFPLPQAAAVDDMTMLVGGRTVKGKIMRREQAEEVYAAARSAGQVASLLDQERPNIFTQSVANIMPGERVKITISYVETLKYEEGAYEFSFPLVVGPRYIPGAPTGPRPRGGRRPATTRVPDAPRVTPPVAPHGTRAGHDVSVEVTLDAGVPVEELKSPSHEIEVGRPSASGAHVRLKSLTTIPNKDFILRYAVAGRKMQDALLAHGSGRGGYFTLILQPPARVTAEDVTPKELVFVLDTSGSMSGAPIEKAKATMLLALEGLYPQDTFNLITFAGDTHILFPEPVPATPENLSKARRFLEEREGFGGTEMMQAIKAALDPSDSQGHIRIVCFMTDGYVGNDFEIISEVRKHPNARVFSFGIGGAVNHFLLDQMAEHGMGAVDYVSLDEDGGRAARRFHERVRNPLLTDIQIDWGTLHVEDVYPRRVPDLFGAAPVILSGRYTAGGRGVVRLRGRMGGQAFEREIPVELPESQPGNEVLATLWARRRVADLLSEDYAGTQRGETREDLRETITSLGLEYRLLTQFTSFVAVEEMTFTDGGKPRRIEVPVELPEGMSPQDDSDAETVHAGNITHLSAFSLPTNRPAQSQRAVFGASGRVNLGYIMPSLPSPTPPPGTATVVSSGALKSKAIPPSSLAAFQTRGKGNFTVKVVVDEAGRVVSARAVSGNPLLRQSVETAALQARFAPTLKAGRPVKVSGVMTYKYDAAGVAPKVSSILGGVPTAPIETEEQWRRRLGSKMHPLVASVVERLRDKKVTPGAEEATFIHDGKAELRIRLSAKSPAVLARLKQLGFELVLNPQSSRFVLGRLPIEKLAALLDVEAVLYVTPQQ